MTATEVRRIGMWSGPRNISTAMMRSWGSRGDTAVCDEPFYAHYLAETERNHPGRDEVIAAHETEWSRIVAFLLGPVPGGKTIFYQKHMAHHLPQDLSRDPGAEDDRLAFLSSLTNVLLIREPGLMLTSLAKVLENPTTEETGLPQQVWLMRYLVARGLPLIVIDSKDVLIDPDAMLRALCDAVGAPYDSAMLSWKPGMRETDGVWAKHWYENVAASTGFARYEAKEATVPGHLRGVLEECDSLYAELAAHKLSPQKG